MSAGSVAGVAAQDVLKPVEVGNLQPLTVTGGAAEIFKSVGAAAYISDEEIRQAGYLNLNQILAKVPGVYTRDEDGFGQFPNISLRGVDGTRSEKVTVMEDGILTAPSPYSAPAAYYSPKVARMAGIELMKGSSQVRYGPQTTGGVINFLSTAVPDERRFYSRSTYGSYNTQFNHTWYGDTVDVSSGRFGYLLELHSQKSDGLRDVDFSSGDTGFDLFEPMIKLFWEPNTALKQKFEMKVGYTDLDSNESYTGLTEADLGADPDRRYAATQFDRFTAEQWRTYLKWIAEPSDALRIESAVYFNQFEREWDKIDQVAGTALHEALLDPARVGILNGTAPGQFRNTNNLRDHEGYGWQNQANFRFDTGALAHDLAVGLRLHYDRVDALAQRTIYTGNGAGAFTPAPGPITNNGTNEAFATAVYVEDTITTGKLTLRPGVRYEHLSLDYTNPGGTNFSGDEELFTAGIGASYEFTPESVLFGGIYRGVAAPSPQAYLVNGVENEESIGYEIGYRYQRDSFGAEAAAFYTDFNQLISTDAGFGFTNTNQNAGTAEVFGLEMLVEYDAAETLQTGFGLPVYLSATWTQAQFTGGNLIAGGGGGVYAGARDGNDIPYVPEWKLAAGVGITGENWGVNLDMVYTSSSWGTGYNGDTRPGTQTIRDGRIPALLLFDLTANYQLNDNIKLLAGVHNLFDERELVSRIPEGPRANAPRMLFAGVEATF
jgi:Fe(3+) dicitrate transport protein